MAVVLVHNFKKLLLATADEGCEEIGRLRVLMN